MYTVHTGQKPARPGLGIVLSGSSLAAVLALAAGLSHVKLARLSVHLGERVSPPGWNISFRPPAGWLPAPYGDDELDEAALRFREPRSAVEGRQLVLRRGEAAGDGPAVHVAAATVPRWVLTSVGGGGLGLQLTTPVAKPFGSLPGAETEFRLGGSYGCARVGLEPDGASVCAMLLSPWGGSSHRAVRILDQVVASVSYLGPEIRPAHRPGLPFEAPAGTRACHTEPHAVLPHFALFPDPAGSESWRARVWEAWLIDGRRPEDLLRDIARVHLERADLPEEPSRRRFGGRECLTIHAPAGSPHEASFSYWLCDLGEGRIVAAVAGCTASDQAALDEAMGVSLGNYTASVGQGPSLERAAAVGQEVIRRLPEALSGLEGTAASGEWALLRKSGRPEGFVYRTVGRAPAGEPGTLDVFEVYFRWASTFSLKGSYRARLAPGDWAYEVHDEWEAASASRAEAGSWEESQAAGASARRSVSIRSEKLESTFRPGELFVPDPALEVAVYLVARAGQCGVLTSTTDDLSETAGGLIVGSVAPEVLDELGAPGHLGAGQVRHAARIERDYEPEKAFFWGFDDQGRLVRAHFGHDVSLVACAADEVISRYPEAARLLAR